MNGRLCSGQEHTAQRLGRRAFYSSRGTEAIGRSTHRDSSEWQLPAVSHNSHFPNLFAIVTQDLEEPIQDLWQVIQQVNVWHRHQNQDLMEGSSERES